MKNFELEGRAYIELNKLLKFYNFVESGGEANAAISAGEVVVNGEVELRRRKKMVVGDSLVFAGQTVNIVE